MLKHCVVVAAVASGALGQALSPANPAAEVRRESLMGFLEGLPEGRAVRGSVEAQKGLIETERYIAERLTAMGYEPRLQDLVWNLKYQDDQEKKLGASRGPVYGGPLHPATTPELAANTWHNIIVEIPGTTTPREVLIIGAHFDAVAGAPGADDNGTGTAALLETARVLRGRALHRTVRLVFFNLEEIGLRGAGEYVKALLPTLGEGEAGKDTLIGMVSLEMLGYFTDEPGSQKSPIPRIEGVFEPPTVGDFIGIATVKSFSPFARAFEAGMREAAPGLKIVVADFPPVAPPDYMRSDHAPFMMSNLPALMLTDTSNYRNPNYHRPTDTIATLDPERFTLVARGVAGATYTLAMQSGPVTAGPPTVSAPPAQVDTKKETPMPTAVTPNPGRAVTMRGTPVTLEGHAVRTGEKAPEFTATGIDLSDKKLSDFKGKTVILSTVPSLDTPVCDIETRKFNERAAEIPDAAIVTVSMDLPFALKRWCGAHGIERVVTVSDYKYRDIGEKFGVRMKETGLLARAIFVIDPSGTIAYQQIVPEIAQEPDYDAVIAAAKRASGK
jgi:thiol peroxidase